MRNVRATLVVIFSVFCLLVDTILALATSGDSRYTAGIYIMSTGLYVARAFLKADGTRCHRLRAALAEVGPAVFNGGVSTFLAIYVVVFSENFGWRRLFKCLMMSTFFGLFHRLALL